MRAKRKWRGALDKTWTYLAAIALMVWTLAPILWMVISSISAKSELLSSGPLRWPEHPTFVRYEQVFASIGGLLRGESPTESTEVFFRALLNSVAITLMTTALALVLGGMAAYAFARLNFRGKSPLLMLALFIQLLPAVTLVIPLYYLIRALNLIDQMLTLVVVYLSGVLSYVIWVLNGYYKTIPPDLESAARIDGCTYFQAFYRIVLPLAKPGFVAVGALAFLLSWDEFLYALIFTNSASTKTVTVALSEFSTKHGVDYGMLMTGGCLATVIPLALALFFQRYIVMGLTAGGVKD